MNDFYLGVDPGRSKTGLAVTDGNGKIFYLLVAQTALLEKSIHQAVHDYDPCKVVIGNGTNSGNIADKIRQWLPQIPLQVVEEAHSTEEARSLYWQENPPKGLRRFIPRGMLVPPEPLDAYAAVVLLKRYLKL